MKEKPMTEQESLQLITSMIQKAKCSYHDRGTGALLWGSMVTIASVITFIDIERGTPLLPFDEWLLVLFAIVPQIYFSVKESKETKVRRFEDDAINALWIVYGLTIFGLIAYQNIIPGATEKLMNAEHWQLVKHYTDGSKPDEHIKAFTPSSYSLFILIYAFPTLATGIAKRFWPMTVGGIITYGLFVTSCFTPSKYDYLLGAAAAIVCWLIPGIVLKTRYLQQKKAHV